MGSDDGITLVRSRLFHAVLSCTTCRVVVAVGPTSTREPLAAYELGRSPAGLEGVKHLGICAGGALDVTIEEVPNPPAPASSPPPRLELVK